MKAIAPKVDKQKQKTAIHPPSTQAQKFASTKQQTDPPIQTPLAQFINPRPQLPSKRPRLVSSSQTSLTELLERSPQFLSKPLSLTSSSNVPVQKMNIAEKEQLQKKFNPIQPQENKTGLPDNLKPGVESLSELDMSDVRVYYNSSKPTQLNALAYAQGSDIHVAPDQEKHLPHEAWHVVQQKQGRVKPTMQIKGVDNPKSGIENLSSYSMDDAKAHFNSSKAPQLNAHAYTQGPDIHNASGREKYLPHEAWYVVQQKQARVKSTIQMKSQVNVNDDADLEQEADLMGARALQMKPESKDQLDSRPQSGSNSVFQLARMVGTHTALADGNVRNLNWNSIATFQMDDDLTIVNNNQAVWRGVNHVWGKTATSLNGWINESKVSEGAPDLADVLWSRARKGATYVDDIFTNLGFPGGWAAASGQPWYVGTDSAEENTKNFARHLVNGQVSAPQAFVADQAFDADLEAVLRADLFMQGMLAGEIARTGTPAKAGVIGGVQNPTGMLLRAAQQFNNIVTTPVPQIATESVSKIDPVSYMSNDGTTITRGTGATEGILLHELGHHLENNLDPADFATLHNFIRARAVDDGTGAPRMKGVGYKRLGGTKSSAEGYDTLPMNYNVKNMAGIGMKTHLAKLGIKKGFGLNSDATKTGAKREIEDSMLSWGNSNDVSYYTQSDSGNYATEFLSTSIEFFAKGTTVDRMVSADPLRVALLLYLANRPQYILVRDALQARRHLPPPMPGTNYLLDNLIHKVSI